MYSERLGYVIKKHKENKCVIIIFIGLIVFVAFHWYTYNHREQSAYTDSRHTVEININQSDSIYQNSYKSDEKIDLNTASVDELDSLMYIGKDEAQRIVEYREKHGDFESIEDIYNISGLNSRIRKIILDYTYI